MKSKMNYNALVDYLISQMRQSTPNSSQQPMKDSEQFSSQTFQDYKAEVDKQREKYSEMSITEMLYDLGYKIDNALSKIYNSFQDDFKPENVKCEIDNEQVDCKEFSEDINLDAYSNYDKEPDGGIFDA